MLQKLIRNQINPLLQMRKISCRNIIYYPMSFVFKPDWEDEGKGARVIRVIGGENLKRLDPFILMDYFHVKLPAGFPDHPHRGFQTVTYMLQGQTYHQDFKGHKGATGPGDVQWMTAGKGIMHSEIPGSFEEMSIGFQLWLNLKADQKMVQPKYQQFKKNQIPFYQKDQSIVKIICGQWQGHQGPVKYETPAFYFDVASKSNGKFQLPIKAHWNSLLFIYEGNAIYHSKKGQQLVELNHCCVLDKGEEGEIVHKVTATEGGAKFILFSGEPLNEPFAHRKFFVMNTPEQVQEAFKDYETRSNGFEDGKNWESKIKKMRDGVKYEDL